MSVYSTSELGHLCQDLSVLQISGAFLERREEIVFPTKVWQINRERVHCTNAVGHGSYALVSRLFVDLIWQIMLPNHSLNAD